NFFQYMVSPFLSDHLVERSRFFSNLQQLGDSAFGIIQIAKHNGIRWTSFRTSHIHIRIRHFTALALSRQFTRLDPLNTQATLLHHAPRSYGNIRIEYHLTKVTVLGSVNTRKILVIMVFKPVEPSYFIRTVVGTISCSDTSVVCHLIEPFRTVRSSYHRTNRLTWRIVTVLTSHWLEGHFGIIRSYFQFLIGFGSFWRAIIPVNSDPGHLPSVQHFLLTYYCHVVFHLTGNGTGTASYAGVHVYGHSP